MKVLFTSKNLIGDSLYVGPALRAWIKKQETPVDVWILTLNDHVAPLYEGMVRDLWNPGTLVHTFGTCYERPNVDFDKEHTFDVNAAFKLSDQKKQHLATSYAELLGVNIGTGPASVKPIYIPIEEELREEEKGLILVSMFSASCTSRDPKIGVPNKMVPWEKWMMMLGYLWRLAGEWGIPIRYLGAPTDSIPELGTGSGIIRPEDIMFGIPLNRLALIMRNAKLLVTIDNGMAHLAATQECPTFEMYPVALGTHYILPVGNPNLVYVHMNPVTVNPKYLLNGLRYAVSKFEKTVWRENDNRRDGETDSQKPAI